ncbi:hypothetical protein CK203_002282 [Vitis vinifera]|uniref:Uncharacterized protein n=1 Tax=Vitis vinifera TaxID=29760 RepID=A0A438KJ48_VITVI|nr:hypothetical protein CK203_002282 [Vitis vinifera]
MFFSLSDSLLTPWLANMFSWHDKAGKDEEIQKTAPLPLFWHIWKEHRRTFKGDGGKEDFSGVRVGEGVEGNIFGTNLEEQVNSGRGCCKSGVGFLPGLWGTGVSKSPSTALELPLGASFRVACLKLEKIQHDFFWGGIILEEDYFAKIWGGARGLVSCLVRDGYETGLWKAIRRKWGGGWWEWKTTVASWKALVAHVWELSGER